MSAHSHSMASRPASSGNRAATRPGGGDGGNRINNGGDRINTGDRNSNNRINTGDININTDNDWHNGGWDWDDHPIAGGLAVGAAIGIGARAFALPYGCSPYYGSYYSCGGVYYQPQYEGDTVVYVTVSDPATTTTTTTTTVPVP